MIRLTTLLLGLILIQSVSAQTTVEDDQSNSSKFHIGIHFATLQYTLEMQSLKSHSIWGGTDFGTDELNDEEIAEINSYVDYEKRISGPFIEAGMIFLNKAGKPFYIDGKILLGIGMKKYKVYNSRSNNTEMEVKSNKINPWLGISFNIPLLCISIHNTFHSSSSNTVSHCLFGFTRDSEISHKRRQARIL